MRRCALHVRRHLGGLFAIIGIMIIFVCVPIEFFLLALGVGMTVIGVVLLNIS